MRASANGIPIALAGILDCTNWNMPDGGWKMPVTVGAYRFFFQSVFPGGGRGAVATNNQELSCTHVYVAVDPAVLAWVKAEAMRIVGAAPKDTKFFALLIRGLTVGINLLSPLERIQAILQRLGIECQIASAGLFAHEFYSANLQTLADKYRAGSQIMVIGHSTGGDEAAKIAAALAVLEAE
jgi:hypothetical protein